MRTIALLAHSCHIVVTHCGVAAVAGPLALHCFGKKTEVKMDKDGESWFVIE